MLHLYLNKPDWLGSQLDFRETQTKKHGSFAYI